MKRWIPSLLLLMIVAAVYALEHQASTPSTNLGEQPVLVELFTSQGCSSCPPADELLRKIARDPNLRGRAIPLAYHVDYWNHLGWRDPFSAREWSQRQGDYVRALHLDSAYTPQVVINGSRQMVGSSAQQIYRAIEEESKRAGEGSVSLRAEGDQVIVRATAPRDAEVLVAVFENGASTKVLSGENGGRTLADDAIVRQLVRVGKGTLEERVPLKLGPRMGAVAFLQDPKTKRVLTTAALKRPGA
ncbi:MAG TPA: DUF1223 domain-containing protein [Thermoanaerobaculia bacterium]|nr:DUF1223 domain-containing protein [Thermoanaerobaculia bacterium]